MFIHKKTRYLKTFITLFFIFSLLTSCCKDPYDNSIDNTQTQQTQVEKEDNLPTLKTIFVYMPWTASKSNDNNSLHDDFIRNLEDIEEAIVTEGGLKQTRVLVFIDSLAPKNAELFEIKYKNNACYHKSIKKYNTSRSPFYTKTQGLTSLLQEIKNIAPASIYSMIIGSHGVGWLPANYRAKPKTRFFGGTTLEYQTDISTLTQSIKNANMQMQYIMFDDCYMSTIEVAYDLREVTHYLIGCTSEIMAYGMPYSKMWKELSSISPNYQQITDDFYNFYSNYNSPDYNCGAIGITDCTKTQEMATLMKEINGRYKMDKNKIDDVQKLDGYAPTIFYDMGDYVDKLCQDKALYQQFRNLLYQLTPYHAATQRIYSSMNYLSNPYIHIQNFSGITISDLTESNIYNAETHKQYTNWWRATH